MAVMRPLIEESPVTVIPPDDTVSVVGVVIAPVDAMVVVAVPPIYATPAESCVELARENCCNPVQMFGLERFNPMVRAVLPL